MLVVVSTVRIFTEANISPGKRRLSGGGGARFVPMNGIAVCGHQVPNFLALDCAVTAPGTEVRSQN